MQNDDGFIIIEGEIPPDELVAAAEAEVRSKRCGVKCRELMRYGLRFPEDAWFQRYLGCSYNDPRTQKVGDTTPMYFENRSGRRVPGPPGTVLIFRAATRDGLNSENGFFKIIPRSHRMTADEIRLEESSTINLRPRDVLFMVANSTVEYNVSGNGVALREAVSADLAKRGS